MGPRLSHQGAYRRVVALRRWQICEAVIIGKRCLNRAQERRADPVGIYRMVCIACFRARELVFNAAVRAPTKHHVVDIAPVKRSLRPLIPSVAKATAMRALAIQQRMVAM